MIRDDVLRKLNALERRKKISFPIRHQVRIHHNLFLSLSAIEIVSRMNMLSSVFFIKLGLILD
jgi:hypothetical protein